MNVSKIFTNNDIYFIEVVSDKIVINDNYNGVFILDYELNIKKELKILDDMSIDVSFIKDKEIVLYCYENRCLIYINIDTYVYKIISLNEELNDIVFLPLYEWIDNDLMLLSDNGNVIIHVNLLHNTIKKICKENINKYKFSIHSDWRKLSGKVIYKIYPNECNAVLEINNKIALYNYQDNEETILTIDSTDLHNNDIPSSYIYHDIEVKNDFIVEISEKKVAVLYKKEKILLYPESMDCSFWRGKLINIEGNDYLILLQCSNSDSQKARIEKYDVKLLFNRI